MIFFSYYVLRKCDYGICHITFFFLAMDRVSIVAAAVYREERKKGKKKVKLFFRNYYILWGRSSGWAVKRQGYVRMLVLLVGIIFYIKGKFEWMDSFIWVNFRGSLWRYYSWNFLKNFISNFRKLCFSFSCNNRVDL